MRANNRPVSLYAYTGAGQPDEPWTGPKCGTNRGYNEHRENREPICEDCRVAHNEYTRDYRLRTGRTRTVRVYLTPAQRLFLSRASSDGAS